MTSAGGFLRRSTTQIREEGRDSLLFRINTKMAEGGVSTKDTFKRQSRTSFHSYEKMRVDSRGARDASERHDETPRLASLALARSAPHYQAITHPHRRPRDFWG
jgi:hypothetical protein